MPSMGKIIYHPTVKRVDQSKPTLSYKAPAAVGPTKAPRAKEDVHRLEVEEVFH